MGPKGPDDKQQCRVAKRTAATKEANVVWPQRPRKQNFNCVESDSVVGAPKAVTSKPIVAWPQSPWLQKRPRRVGPKGPNDKTKRWVAPKTARTNDRVAQLKIPEHPKNQTTCGPKGHAKQMKMSRGPKSPQQHKRQCHVAPEAAQTNETFARARNAAAAKATAARGPQRPRWQNQSSYGRKGRNDKGQRHAAKKPERPKKQTTRGPTGRTNKMKLLRGPERP